MHRKMFILVFWLHSTRLLVIWQKGKSLTSAGNQDIAYKGVASKWLAAAHALKARYLLHKLAVEPNVLSEVATAVQKAIDNGFEGFTVTGFNGSTCDNPWSAYVFSRQYTAPSKNSSRLDGSHR